jgi:hypothetical protein
MSAPRSEPSPIGKWGTGYGAGVTVVARVAACAACAAVLCPSAAAFPASLLALMPLPLRVFGPDAAALSLVRDSGVDSNADAARDAGRGVTAADLSRYGRVTGYTLDYDHSAPGALRTPHALLEVQTIAELYRDQPAATRGLAFWRGVTRALTATKANGISVRLVPFEARVADGTFAFELTYRFAGRPILYVGDVVFRSADLLGAVFVTATDDIGLRERTSRLAHKLAARIQQVLAGRIHGPPVTIPGKK